MGIRSKPVKSTLYGLALLAGGWLVGCNSSGTSAIEGSQPETSLADTPSKQAAVFDANQDPRAYCPKTVMRAGTETFNVYPDDVKRDDPDKAGKLRFRGTITDVVRECNYGGADLYMKVGIAGRVLSGPSGESGNFVMPIRIAVTRGDEVLYSKLHDVPAEILPGRTNGTFSFVDSEIVLPKPEFENIIIYAGYDEQRVDIPGAQPVQEELEPVN